MRLVRLILLAILFLFLVIPLFAISVWPGAVALAVWLLLAWVTRRRRLAAPVQGVASHFEAGSGWEYRKREFDARLDPHAAEIRRRGIKMEFAERDTTQGCPYCAAKMPFRKHVSDNTSFQCHACGERIHYRKYDTLFLRTYLTKEESHLTDVCEKLRHIVGAVGGVQDVELWRQVHNNPPRDADTSRQMVRDLADYSLKNMRRIRPDIDSAQAQASANDIKQLKI